MASNKNNKPTDSELEILQILWDQGPSTVREVHDRLNEKRDIGYTTTLKLMQIMNEKKLTTRDTSSRIHVYTSNVKEKDTKGYLLQSFIDSTFKGSAMNLVMQALGNHDASREELEEIKALINKMENK